MPENVDIEEQIQESIKSLKRFNETMRTIIREEFHLKPRKVIKFKFDPKSIEALKENVKLVFSLVRKWKAVTKPKILLLDQPHPKAKAILDEFAECFEGNERHKVIDRDTDLDAVYTQLSPVKCYDVPVFCPCTSVEHISAPKIIYLDDEWKQKEGQEVTSTAEHAWSLILQLAKMKRMQLCGRTLGIIGFGRIGKMVSRYAAIFGMDICFVDPYEESDWDYYDVFAKNVEYKKVDLSELLNQSDIVTLHIPLEGNEGFIGKKELAMMKPGALLVNTSRQPIVDIDALIPYLEQGKLFYADDFKNDRDITQYGAIQTPHIAGNCLEAREATDIYIANKIKEFFQEV
jgi:phosphoglycerate dehydrogenase-like enzyme